MLRFHAAARLAARTRVSVFILVCALAGAAMLGGCGTTDEALATTAPGKLYAEAHQALISNDFNRAVKLLEAMEARFPFAPEARQAQLDLMYAYYRTGETESAVDAADTFIRENPTHPRVDYAHYIKGLVYFERVPNMMERWFKVDLHDRPPQDARKSFQSFGTLIQRYPDSEYAHDARQRMVYLRNRLADYEVHVADYYLRRGAYVAAIARAKFCIENYDGAPAVRDALEVQIQSYEGLGLKDLADQSRKVYLLNYPDRHGPDTDRAKPWWKFW
jgi:outer membrane protein assembly factor BamD